MAGVRAAMLDHAVPGHTWRSGKTGGTQLPDITDHNIHITPGPLPLDFCVREK